MKIDNEFRVLIPPLSKEEYEQLEQNILKEGCRDALVTWQGIFIDGHNRYEICTNNNIKYNTIEKNFSCREEVMEWIILNQFGRRNINIYQRSELALKLKPIFEEKARENILSTQNNNNSAAYQKSEKQIHTTKELAKIV